MSRLFNALILGTALLTAGAPAGAADPAFVGKYITTPQDIAAIEKVALDFRTALKTKNTALLSSLMIASNILFSSPPSPAEIADIRAKHDANYTGLQVGGYESFAKFIRTEKEPIDERFYNVRITQDDNIAVVMFDFDFVKKTEVVNHGLEVWQMMKDKDGKWKIASVFWSSKGKPK